MEHFCHFRLSDIHTCLPIHQVQQVYENADIQTVPLSPPAVLGLVNLRGMVIAALDMRVVLHLPTAGAPPTNKLVAHAGGHSVALVVDEVVGVQTVGTNTTVEGAVDAVLPLPPNLAPHLRSLTSGVICRDDALVLVVDAEKILASGGSV